MTEESVQNKRDLRSENKESGGGLEQRDEGIQDDSTVSIGWINGRT